LIYQQSAENAHWTVEKIATEIAVSSCWRRLRV